MRVTRRFVTFAATLALAAPSLLQVSRLSAQSSEEAAVLQAVDALTKAMLDADRARLEELVADQLSYGHSSGVIQTKAQFVDVIINKQTIYKSIVLSEPSTVIAGNNAIVRHMAAVDYEDGEKPGPPRSVCCRCGSSRTAAGSSWRGRPSGADAPAGARRSSAA